MGVRIGVLCSILVSYIICYTLSAGVIARGTALFMGICAATFLPAYFCSLFWKKGDQGRSTGKFMDGGTGKFVCHAVSSQGGSRSSRLMQYAVWT